MKRNAFLARSKGAKHPLFSAFIFKNVGVLLISMPANSNFGAGARNRGSLRLQKQVILRQREFRLRTAQAGYWPTTPVCRLCGHMGGGQAAKPAYPLLGGGF